MTSKKAKSKSKGRTTRRAKANKSMRGSMQSLVPSKFVRSVCSITDPFCPAASGSKYPDATSLKTLAWDAEFYSTLTTDSSGRGALLFAADPGCCSSAVTSFLTTSMTITGTSIPLPVPTWASIGGGVVELQYRCVSMGIEVRSVLSAMNNQGSIGIAVLPSGSGPIGTVNIDLNSASFVNERVSASNPNGISAISYNDGVISKEFKWAAGALANTVSSVGNDVLIAYIVGGPASTASIQVRFVAHYELTFQTTSVFNSLATRSATENDTVTSAANYVKNHMSQIATGAGKEFERRTMSTAEQFGRFLFRSAATAAGTLIGGPVGGTIAGGAAGMIMDVD